MSKTYERQTIELQIIIFVKGIETFQNIILRCEQIIFLEKILRFNKWSLIGNTYVEVYIYKLTYCVLNFLNILHENELEFFEELDKDNTNFKEIFITEKSYDKCRKYLNIK